MIRRFPAVLRLVLLVAGFLGFFSAFYIDYHILVRYTLALFWVGSVIFYATSRRCPYCRRFGLDSRPFFQNSGYCSHCGKLVEYRRKERASHEK